MESIREPPPASVIAQERVDPGPPRAAFLAATAALSVGAAAAASYAGLHPTGPFPVETAAAGNPGSWFYPLGVHAARFLSAACAGLAVGAASLAARRLFHADAVGLLAGALLAADPALLAAGRLATPETLGLAALLGALACFLAVPARVHWIGAAFLGLATLVDPRSILWGLPLAFLAALRGHIYAATPHVTTALLQGLAAPAAGLLLNLASGGPGLATLPCSSSPGASLLLLEAPFHAAEGAAVAAVHNPVTWFGGLGALLFLAGGTLWMVLRQVRMARLPGRLQLRLSYGLPPPRARFLWLLAFAALAPSGLAWAAVFAVALAAGILFLSEDAPGFGVALALVAVAFAALSLVRAWALVTGSGDAAAVASDAVPWGLLVPCG